jgi:hypothetical protein
MRWPSWCWLCTGLTVRFVWVRGRAVPCCAECAHTVAMVRDTWEAGR